MNEDQLTFMENQQRKLHESIHQIQEKIDNGAPNEAKLKLQLATLKIRLKRVDDFLRCELDKLDKQQYM